MSLTADEMREASKLGAPIEDELASIIVRSEPRVYDRYASHSYFRDLAFRAEDPAAEARLARHAAQVNEDRDRQDREARRDLNSAGIEYRTNPSRTQGQGGYFSPPAWLIEAFATAPRTGRVLAALMPRFDLPLNVQSVNVPYIAIPGTTAQAGPDLAPVPDSDLPDGYDSSAVVTVDGKTDVSMQLLEQSPQGAHLDWAIFQDLTEAYDFGLEQQLIFGTGTNTTSGPGNGQLVGVTTRSTISTVTWTSGTPTDVTFYNQLGILASRVGNNRKRPPEAWLMRTSRWAWLGSSPDTSSRPFVLPTGVTNQATVPDATGAKVSDDLLGWPVFVDDAIPATLGAAANQDEVIALRPSDLMLLEGDPRAIVATEVLSGTLTARILYRRYVAAITGRRVSGIAVLQGTGLVVPASYST